MFKLMYFNIFNFYTNLKIIIIGKCGSLASGGLNSFAFYRVFLRFPNSPPPTNWPKVIAKAFSAWLVCAGPVGILVSVRWCICVLVRCLCVVSFGRVHCVQCVLNLTDRRLVCPSLSDLAPPVSFAPLPIRCWFLVVFFLPIFGCVAWVATTQENQLKEKPEIEVRPSEEVEVRKGIEEEEKVEELLYIPSPRSTSFFHTYSYCSFSVVFSFVFCCLLFFFIPFLPAFWSSVQCLAMRAKQKKQKNSSGVAGGYFLSN